MNVVAAFTDGQKYLFESTIIAIVVGGWLGGNLIYAIVAELLRKR